MYWIKSLFELKILIFFHKIPKFNIFSRQENAIYYDSYIEVQNSNQNRQARIKKLENFDDENTGNDSLKDTYPRVPTSTKEKIKEAKQKFQRNNPNKKLEKRILSAYTWLHVQMPSEFNYTVNLLAKIFHILFIQRKKSFILGCYYVK